MGYEYQWVNMKQYLYGSGVQWEYIVLTEQSCVSSLSGETFPRETCKKSSIDRVEWVIERELLFLCCIHYWIIDQSLRV